MRRIAFLPFLLFFQAPCKAQPRMLTHVTPESSPFSTRLVLENLAESEQTLELKGFDWHGQLLGSQSYTLNPGQRLFEAFPASLQPASLAYVQLTGSSSIRAGVSIEGNSEESARAYLAESTRPASLWRLMPNARSQLFDGLAIINPQAHASAFELRYRDATGTILQQQIYRDVAPGTKVLITLDAAAMPENGYLELMGYDPLFLTALSGSRPERGEPYLWVQPAEANRWSQGLEAKLARAHGLWLKTLGSTLRYEAQKFCFCRDTRRVQVTERGGKVLEMRDVATGTLIPQEEWSLHASATDAFQLLHDSIEWGAQSIRAEFDPTHGFPTEIEVDSHEYVADDEIRIILERFQIVEE
jgi:hypothetical protein